MRLARLGKHLGRPVLADACCIFSPDAVLRRHHALIARKYDGSRKTGTPGRKRISEQVEQLIVQIARKHKTRGSRRIKGQLKYLGHMRHEEGGGRRSDPAGPGTVDEAYAL